MTFNMSKSVWMDIDDDFAGPDLELQFDNFLDDIAKDADNQLCSVSVEPPVADDCDSFASTSTSPHSTALLPSPGWQNSTIYLLTSDAEDEELNRAQKAYDKVVAAKETADRREQLPPSLPKIMKNDIRRYFSRMFMNTVNSADFRNIQSYFHTFMSSPCKFVADHGNTVPDLHIPDRMIAAGPTLMSHYLLGCFVQYPDMVMNMKSSRIVTSSSWAGTKIVMEMEIRSTKMYDLEMDEWIPQFAQLGEKYSQAIAAKAAAAEVEAQAAKKRRKAAALKNSTDNEAVTLHASSEAAASNDHNFSDNTGGSVSVGDESPHTSALAAQAHTSSAEGGSTLPEAPAVTPPAPTADKKSSGNAAKSKTESKGGGKSKQSASNKKRGSDDAQLSDRLESSTSLAGAQKSAAAAEIPEAYVHGLIAKARLLPQPISLELAGTITMFLDDSNHMQHMSLDMRQTNR